MNNLSGVVFDLPLIKDIKEVTKVKQAIDKFFNPNSVLASNTLANICAFVPFFIYNRLFKRLNKNIEIILSNVSGSRTPLMFAD